LAGLQKPADWAVRLPTRPLKKPVESMQEQHYDEILNAVLAKDPRFHRDAYLFLREALDYTQKRLHQGKKVVPRHVTGQELLQGIREYALAQFGPMTLTLFAFWGVCRCEDFGQIVFNLVDAQLLSKTEQDSPKDFEGVYDFAEAFRKPFLPKAKWAEFSPGSKP
jgi:uncharacterized repeat protein (TIGR04138 family)